MSLAKRLIAFFLDLRPKQAERWSRIRVRGPLRFVIVYGVLLYGVPIVSVCNILNYLLFKRFLDDMRRAFGPSYPGLGPEFIRRIVLGSIGLAIVGGAVFGISMWFLMEALYRRYSRLHRNSTTLEGHA